MAGTRLPTSCECDTTRMDAKEIVQTYGAAWGETDEAKRRKILEACWADDGTYIDPTGRADGREAFVAHIAGFQAMFADHRMDVTSGVDEHDRFLRFEWRMTDPSGATVLEGMDFGRIGDDGRLALICGFFGPFPSS
jgi:hypothetical protein